MKYTIDLNTSNGFVQIFGAVEFGDNMARPVAFQVRGGASLVASLVQVLAQGLTELERIYATFHEDPAAQMAFEQGHVVFQPGEIPLTLMLQRSSATLLIGQQLFGEGPVRNLPGLLEAAKLALRTAG